MTRAWYRGDCHVHSHHSDGELSPARLAAEARAAGLHFLATTDHNTAAAHGTWPTGPGDPLAIPGAEVTTRTGHWLALGLAPGRVIDWHHDVRDGAALHRALARVRRDGGLCVAAHPHAPYPSGTFQYPYDGFDAVEVWNGAWTSDLPWQADNEAALAEWGRALAAGIHAGRWRPAMGNSDAHLAGQLGIPHTVVRATGPDPGALLAALRAGHSWIAASAGIDLSCTAHAAGRTAGIGERLAAPGDPPCTVRLTVRGVDGGTVTLHDERGPAHRATLRGAGAHTVEWGTSAGASGFVRAEVRDADGRMAALTNPVLLTGRVP